jgi:peptide/nickel transport system permease protein
MVPTLAGITLVTFLLIRLAPGDPVAFKVGQVAGPSVAAGDAQAAVDREKQILRAKVRLGLMEETGTVRFWRAGDLGPLARLEAHAGGLRALAWSPDGALLAVGGDDGAIVLTAVERGGSAGAGAGATARAGDARRLATLTGHERGVNALAFAPGGALLASAGDDRTVRLWEAGDGGWREAAVLRGHERLVASLAFSPDGALLASGSRDRTIVLWDVAARKEAARLERHYLDVLALAFSPGGEFLASGSLDRTVVVWNVAARRSERELSEHAAAVHALAWSPDGSLLAAGLSANAVQVWDAPLFAARLRLEGHAARVNALAFDPAGGRRLASAGADGSLRLWDLETGAEAALGAGHSSGVLALAWRPGGGGEIASGALDTQDVPLLSAYLDWLWRLARLDLGLSFKDGRPVKDRVLEALPITLKLNLISILIAYLISIPIGALAAARRAGLFDHASSLIVFLLYSMPSFWVGTMLILIFGSQRGFTATRLGPFSFTLPFVNVHDQNAHTFTYLEHVLDHWRHLVLPLAAITYSSFAFLSRLVRSGMLEVLGLDYIRTARAKGLSESRVVGVHALRNSLISVVTVFGNVLPSLIGGSVIIEYIFSIPGMGYLAFEAILQRDYPVIMAVTTLAAVLTLAGILISDVLYSVVDPRVKMR